jgi:heavy metal translocating P-type ATPase
VVDDDGREQRVPVSALVMGDLFVVRPGEKVATDGVVESGRSALDRSMMTGEAVPVDTGPGDAVTGGTVAVSGRLVVRATRVGADTQLGHMLTLVARAQDEKAAAQRLADRISAVFVPAVLCMSVAVLGGWLATGHPVVSACNAALSVLIIACPCALGLATPAALFVASGAAARRGIFFKGYQALEATRQIDTVVLDKTGTLTEGRMAVVDVACAPGVDRRALLRMAGAVEVASEHPIARAVAAFARAEVGEPPAVEAFAAIPGLGAAGAVEGHDVSVGRAAMGGSASPALPAGLQVQRDRWEALGRTVVVVRVDGHVCGLLAVADTIRPTSAAAVAGLKALGLRCLLVTGDNERTARAVADAVGIDDVVAGTMPDDKVVAVQRLQAAGHSVAVVGDGVNDAPALAVADLGLAIGSGTDVAINAADIIIVRDDLRVVAVAVSLARRTVRTIRSNLVWAFAYNVIAIPVAALGLLDPLIAGGAMALSSAFVVWNSSRLRGTGGAAARRPAPPRRDRRPTVPHTAPVPDRPASFVASTGAGPRG